MKVNFKDCEFGCFEPHFEIEYGGRKYRAIEVEYEMDGHMFSSIITEYALKVAMEKNTGTDDWDNYSTSNDWPFREEWRIDNSVSFYADANDGVYYILETITGEETK